MRGDAGKQRLVNAMLTSGILLAIDVSPAVAGDWQDRLRELERGAPPWIDLTQAPQAPSRPAALAFNIPAGPLPSVLASFGDRAGLQVLYPADLARGRTSPGVSGTLTPEEALTRILTGTGLAARFVNPNTVTVQNAQAAPGVTNLAPVLVEARRTPSTAVLDNLPPTFEGGQVARGAKIGMLGNRDILDTPFNVTAYTAKTIEDQQARRVTDVLMNDPSVRVQNASDGVFDSFYIRGFPVTSIVYTLNGLPGALPTDIVTPESMERIEVLKGPTAMLSGMAPLGYIGGSINIVPKRATDEAITNVTTRYAQKSQFGTHVDVGRRFGTDNQVGVRVNGAYRDGRTALDDQSEQLGLGSIALDFRGERFRASVDAGYQKVDIDAPSLSMTISPGVPIPKAPKAGSNPFADWGFVRHQDYYGALNVEFDIVENLTAHAAFGGVNHRSTFLNPFMNIDDADGNTSVFPYFEPSERSSMSAQAGLRGKFETGPLTHEPSLDIARLRQRGGFFDTDLSGAFGFTSNLYRPISPQQPDTSQLSDNAATTSIQTLTGLAAVDTISIFNKRIQFIVGLRRQTIDVENVDVNIGDFDSDPTAASPSFHETKVSPGFGLIVKPWERVSLYANYIEGLSAGPTAPTFAANAGTVFAPIVSEQYEAGVKVDFGGFATTLSAFQITQPNGVINSATNLFGVDGKQRNRGLELNVLGTVAEGVRLLGGIAFIDAEQLKTADGINDGKTAIGVPKRQINLGVEWDTPFVQGLTLGSRVIYTSAQYYDAANTQSIPDWYRIDLAARYALQTRGTPVYIRAALENLLDRNYWASTASQALSLGTPRTFLLSATAQF